MPTAPDSLLMHTYNVLIDLWLQNFLENLSSIKNGLSAADLPKKNNPCILIGAGPSLKKYNHLSMIAKSAWKHTVLCCDRELENTLRHGIVPYVVSSVDGSPIVSKFYKHRIIRQNMDKINAAFNAIIHPSVVKLWRGKIYWFLNALDQLEKDGKYNKLSVTYILHSMANHKMGVISTIGNVGSLQWNLAYALGCEPIILCGYDYSEQVKDKADAIYFMPFTNMFLTQIKNREITEEDIKKAMDKAADLHQVEENPDFKNYYLVNPIWKKYREMFATHIIQSGRHTINCSGNGCLHTAAIKAPNFEAMNLEDALREFR